MEINSSVCKHKSSSSSHATCMDLPNPLSPPVSIVHRSRQVFQAKSCIGTELLYIGRLTFAYPCEGVYGSISFRSLPLLLHQCPACLVRLTWIVFVMVGRWQYCYCFVECCSLDLFNTARSILLELPSILF